MREPPSCQHRLQLLWNVSFGARYSADACVIPIKFVAAEAGFFPPSLFMLFADILKKRELVLPSE